MAEQAIRANSVLPANREPVTLETADGLQLVGELATPIGRPPVATLVCVHPLPTHGGMMDSHLLRKMAWRLPALVDYAVMRFNTRGTSSTAGTSAGSFDGGAAEGLDVQAAISLVVGASLPTPWLVGWSFGTDVILRHAELAPVEGAVLLSPPLHSTIDEDLSSWAQSQRPVVALIPENDDYLLPARARERFTPLTQARLIEGTGAGHLWVGESSVRFVLNEIVRSVTPGYFDRHPEGLPTLWDGPMERWTDL